MFLSYIRRCAGIVLLLHLWCGTAVAFVNELQILLLHSYHQEYPWTKSQHDGFVNELSYSLSGQNPTFSSEYLDTKREHHAVSDQRFIADYLRQKYQTHMPDLIYSTDDNALRFLMKYKDELFPGVPVVFSGVNSMDIGFQLDREMYTGVYEKKDIPRNIQLITQLLPQEKTILVVGDKSETDVAISSDIMKFAREVDAVERGVRFDFVSETHLKWLVARLAERERGLILLTTIGGLQNERGQPVSLGNSLKAITEAGDFIIISMEDAYMQPGVLGGVVTNGEAQGQAAARLAVDLLRDRVEISSLNPAVGPNVPIFDYRILQKLKVPMAELPVDSVILHEPRSVYQEFKEIIWATTTFIIVLLMVLFFLFITVIRRQKAEKALAESERFLNSVIENIPDMVFVKRADDLRFVRMNRMAEDFLGISRKDIVNRTVFEVFSDEMASSFTEQDQETLRERKLVDIPEEQVVGPAGIHYLHTKKIPILGESGEPRYLVGISRDITKDKQDREKRLALEERLIQAEKMESIGTLAGGIAHDFNNILSSVIGYTELASIDAENPKQVRKYLEGTLKGANRAKDLIRQILTFSRKGDNQHTPVDISDVVHDSLKMLRSTLPTTISIEESLSTPAVCMGDPTQIQQIVFNLCTNAYHAMMERGGDLAVSTTIVTVDPERGKDMIRMTPGSYVRLEVGDTGIGMDAETRQRMFDPYYSTKGPEAGTGLGLAVVHGIVKSHHGHIHVYSEEGVGTTIHVYFPVAENQVVEQKATLESAKVEGRGEHILLIDDEKDIIVITEGLLTRYGYRVSSFTDGRQALAALKEQPNEFAAIVTDMTMPNLTGAELASQALNIAPGLPIILCTGHSEIINREKAEQLGIRAYCEKPMRGDEILLQLRGLLDESLS